MADTSHSRREERREVDWISVIRLPDGTECPCTIKDVSPSGLKICVAGSDQLPETFMIRVVGKQLVFRVRKAWQRDYYLGVTIEKIAKIPDPPAGQAETRAVHESTSRDRLGSRRHFEVNR